MNPKKLSIGMRVVITNDSDATVYTIAQIDGFNVSLVYALANGQLASGGVIDSSYIKGIILA